MNNKILFVLILLVACTNSNAQYYSSQNKVWAFGYKAGLDFKTGVPVPFTSGLDYFFYIEGTASVSDTAGHLLFYTNGLSAYNKDHVLMPHGDTISPFITYSTTQAAVIAPVIGTTNKYYIFSLSEYYPSVPASGRLNYSIVDMSLDGGLGDVIASSIGTPVDDSLSEKMIAITGNNHNIWLLTHRRDTAVFLAYEITAAGIAATPVVSKVGYLSGHGRYAVGVMKASPNRRKLVVQAFDYLSLNFNGSELYDFDPATGTVSNCMVIDSTNSYYGAEFSSDNTKLYAQEAPADDTMKIYQYNLALATHAAIRSSKTLIATNLKRDISDMRLGPDKKIYFLGTDDSVDILGNFYLRYMDRISSPDLLGTACNYTPHIIKFLPGTGMLWGLPNVYVTEDTLGTTSADMGIANAASSLFIYPNPATTVLTVSSPANITHISISNLTGQEVYHSDYNSEAIKVDISTLRPGCYFIKINGTEVRKFTKL
jgi:hypothetical protein